MDKEALGDPTTLLEAVTRFADPDVAHAFVVRMRWPNGMACPRMGCGSADVVSIGNRRAWRCRNCNRQFTAKVGTIFEDSPISLSKWLPAMWLLSSAKNGISSCELARALGVTQKTAWFMLHRIRCAMEGDSFHLLLGEVESDETYVGGKRRDPIGPDGKRIHGGPRKDKTIVQGIMQRGGKMRAFVIPNDKSETLLGNIYRNVDPLSNIYTDSAKAYGVIHREYRHYTVNHYEQYVNGVVHTNHVENFWSVLKRTLAGTYIRPSAKHLSRYLEAQVFRFNARDLKDGERFPKVVKGADGKRLTWKALTGKA